MLAQRTIVRQSGGRGKAGASVAKWREGHLHPGAAHSVEQLYCRAKERARSVISEELEIAGWRNGMEAELEVIAEGEARMAPKACRESAGRAPPGKAGPKPLGARSLSSARNIDATPKSADLIADKAIRIK